MLFFYSNRLGWAKSIAISAAATAALVGLVMLF
jgi:hypothetical protein